MYVDCNELEVSLKLQFCFSLVACSDGDIRVVGSSSELVGRVEVCIGEVWGTVCSDSWDSTDAGVVCSQLGYSRHSELFLISIKLMILIIIAAVTLIRGCCCS